MCRLDLFVSAETFSEAALTRIAADLLLFQRRLVAGMLRLVTRSLRADLFRFYVATIHKRHEGMVASFICCAFRILQLYAMFFFCQFCLTTAPMR